MDKKFDVLGKFIENEGKQLIDISGYVQDVNPKEIASHIEDDTLGQWCESWRSAVTSSLEAIGKHRMTLIMEMAKDGV